jgi:hypothetical protein
MRNLLALLGAAVVAFAALGYFLGWYNVHSIIDGEGHRHQVIDVNPTKAVHDVTQGEEALKNTLQKNQGQPGQQPAPTPETTQTPSAPNAVLVKPTPPEVVPGDGVRLP